MIADVGCRYCFGAPYVCDALAGDSPLCEVGAFAHPAFLKEHHFVNLKSMLWSSPCLFDLPPS